MRIFLVLLLLLAAGCSPSQWNEKLSSPQDRELAQKTIAALRSGAVETLQPTMEPKLYSETLAMQGKVKGVLAAPGTPNLITVSSNTFSMGGITETTKALNYEFGSGDAWMFMQIMLKQSGNQTQVIGWHATPSTVKPSTAGDFNFQGKGIVNYLWIVAMLASTATIVTALILAIRDRGVRHRWAWIIGSMLGFCQFFLNWSTGASTVQPLSFSLFGSAFVKASPFDPWVLSFSLPIVATIYLARRSKLKVRQAPEKPF